MSIRVKICGITTVRDAQDAARLGADAIGLVFCDDSLRVVNVEQAREIVASIPPFLTVVGLFVNAPVAKVNAILNACPIDVLQFHGDEDAAYCRQFNRPYLKAVRVRCSEEVMAAAQQFYDARAILVDAFVPGSYGGTGECFDWSLLPQGLPLPLVLSGGLNPDNVQEAVRVVQPAAVDVSSGVELSKGIKDAARMASFISGVKHAIL